MLTMTMRKTGGMSSRQEQIEFRLDCLRDELSELMERMEFARDTEDLENQIHDVRHSIGILESQLEEEIAV